MSWLSPEAVPDSERMLYLMAIQGAKVGRFVTIPSFCLIGESSSVYRLKTKIVLNDPQVYEYLITLDDEVNSTSPDPQEELTCGTD